MEKRAKRILQTTVAFALLVIVGVWVYSFAVWALGGAAFRPAVLLVFGAGLTIACGILWLANQTGLLGLPPGVRTALWTCLVSGTLAASVATIKAQPLGEQGSSFKIDEFVLLDVDPVQQRLPNPVTRKAGAEYAGATSPVGFLLVVSGFRPERGQPHLRYRFYLEGRGLADLAVVDHQVGVTSPPERVKIFESWFGPFKDRAQVAYVFADRKDIGTGALTLRALVTDLVSNVTRERMIPIVITVPPQT